MEYLFTNNRFLRERIPYGLLCEVIEVIVHLVSNFMTGKVGNWEPGYRALGNDGLQSHIIAYLDLRR